MHPSTTPSDSGFIPVSSVTTFVPMIGSSWIIPLPASCHILQLACYKRKRLLSTLKRPNKRNSLTCHILPDSVLTQEKSSDIAHLSSDTFSFGQLFGFFFADYLTDLQNVSAKNDISCDPCTATLLESYLITSSPKISAIVPSFDFIDLYNKIRNELDSANRSNQHKKEKKKLLRSISDDFSWWDTEILWTDHEIQLVILLAKKFQQLKKIPQKRSWKVGFENLLIMALEKLRAEDEHYRNRALARLLQVLEQLSWVKSSLIVLDFSYAYKWRLNRDAIFHLCATFSDASEQDIAFELLVNAKESGIMVELAMFHMVLESCSHRQYLSLALNIVDYMNQPGSLLLADVKCYAILLKICSGVGDVELSKEIEKQMRRYGIDIDEECLNLLLECSIRGQNFKRSLDLYNKFFNAANPTRIQRPVFQSFINLCAQNYRIDRAFEALDKMILADMIPDVALYNALASASRNAQNIPRIIQVMNKISVAGLCPDVVTYTTLIDALGRQGRVEEAFEALNEMIANRVEPNLYTYTALLNACVRLGDLDLAQKLFDVIPQVGLKPDLHVYSTLIQGYSKRGLVKKAFALLNTMQKAKIDPNIVTYRILFMAAKQHGDRFRMNTLIRILTEDRNFLTNKKIQELVRECKNSLKESRHFPARFNELAENICKGGEALKKDKN